VKPDLNKIYAVLATASRASLVEVKDVWQDLLSMLAVTQRAVMNVSQPVAASADAAVVSFQYDFLFEKAAQDQQLQNALTADLAKLLGKNLRLVFLPQAQWPQVRKKYLVDHQNDGEPKNGDESPATPDNNLTTAEKIWGTAAKNLIELKDD
jgi:DNA polymerase-3 subunit gamma/tau